MKKFLLPVIAIYLFGGCYPSSPPYAETYDLAATNYDPSFDFQAKQTFAIADAVTIITGEVIDDPDGNGKPDFVSEPYNSQIIDAIRTNMTERGWTEVDKNNNPDVIVLPSAMESTTIVYYYDWWYWGWYYPGYPGYGWGWYYPGYSPSYTYSYSTGTLFIAMTDPNGLTPDSNIPVIWTGIVNGLLTSEVASVTSRINTTIDQLFIQSPYLQQ